MTQMKFCRYDIAAYALFMTYAAGSIIIPMVLCQASVELGFPLGEGGLSSGGALQVGRSLSMIPAMLFSGFLAGRWGLKRTLGYAAVCMGAGVFFAGIAPLYAVLLLALIAAGVGEGLIEGLATPFVQELHKDEPGQYINFAHSFWSVGIFTSVLGAGALLLFGCSWRLPVLIVASCSLLPLFILLGKNPGHPYPERTGCFSGSVVWKQTWDILRCPHFWLFFAAMFLAGGGEYGLTFWVASYIQLDFQDTAWMAGVGTACFAGGMFVGRSGAGVLVRSEYLQHLVVFTALAGTAVTGLLPLVQSPWIQETAKNLPFLKIFLNHWILFPLLFVSGLGSAPFWPSVQSYSAIRLPKLDTTMLFVLLSCAGVPGCGFATWLMGAVGNIYGLRASFVVVPLCYFMLAVLIGTDWFFYARSKALSGNSR